MRLKHALVAVVRRARYQRGLTLEQVAELSGVSEQTVSRVLRGRTCNLESVEAILRGLGVYGEMETGLGGMVSSHSHAEQRIADASGEG